MLRWAIARVMGGVKALDRFSWSEGFMGTKQIKLKKLTCRQEDMFRQGLIIMLLLFSQYYF